MEDDVIDDVILDRYRELACASILQGVNDYLESKERDDYALYKWINECTYFDYLDLDREYFYAKVLRLRDKGVKRIVYGKEKYI